MGERVEKQDEEEEVPVADLFDQFIEATTMKNVLNIHQRILRSADLKPCEYNTFFPKYKRAITSSRQRKNWKAKALFAKLEKRANNKCYSNTKAPLVVSKTCDTNQKSETSADNQPAVNLSQLQQNNGNNALQHYNCLVIGAGPAGLRSAIELQLLGASKVLIAEKRSRFSRNNVLHLWPFVIEDLKSLGAKKFYGKFCAGSIDHISIRQLQLILLKVSLIIGCDFRDACSYSNLCPSSIKDTCASRSFNYNREDNCEQNDNKKQCEVEGELLDDNKTCCDLANIEREKEQKRMLNLNGVKAHFESDNKCLEQELHSIEWDIVIGADGRRNTLCNLFPRREFRGRLAIAITANFINRQTPLETSVPEISGLSFIYNQDLFNGLAFDTGICLENIVYYKDDTHYFVMTAKKRSLLERGVLINDYATTQDLLSDKNVNKEALLKYARDTAHWTTGLEPLEFALNHYGQEDCAMFDFTSMSAALHACRALRTSGGGLALMSLVGDSLLEPFWPTGSGCARGFLSALDAAWMCRQWAVNKCPVLSDQHGASIASRSSRNRTARDSGASNKFSTSTHVTTPTTYDKMALSVIAERESIYRILAQTTSENLQQNHSHWTLNPHTRYPNLNRNLILPSQVMHLISDYNKSQQVMLDSKLLSPNRANGAHHSATSNSSSTRRRNKSPSFARSRRSPKKLKSAGASPLAAPKNIRNRRSRSRYDIDVDDDDDDRDYLLELEQSYKDLAADSCKMTQYLNYKRQSSDLCDDLFIPSLSGTLPSSNNLSTLEARRARDIDECLRQRRQRSKITLVRDQLISQMRGDASTTQLFSSECGNVILSNEIKRLREQQLRGTIGRPDSKSRESSVGPLSLLNSIRRCASFAERVKSFENKLATASGALPSESPESSATNTPRTPIDNVKNLPQFVTLQEIMSAQKSGNTNAQHTMKKTHVTKLSKDDWNVKCWETKLVASELQANKNLSTSSRSLNKSVSVDEYVARRNKPKQQVDVFQDRIKEMADKLTIAKSCASRSGGQNVENRSPGRGGSAPKTGWVSHLKQELARGVNSTKKSINGQPMNPIDPNKPIKKLFDDDDDDDDDNDDGIDVDKHYDHLCINRPTNKYLTKGSYTSHLARSKFSQVIETKPAIALAPPPPLASRPSVATHTNKQTPKSAWISRNSSASSDYSTNTGNSSSSTSKQESSLLLSTASSSTSSSIVDVECFRCRKFVSASERLSLGTTTFHRVCLTCSKCCITLRTNEVQHYMQLDNLFTDNKRNANIIEFLCSICEPNIRFDLTREANNRLSTAVELNSSCSTRDNCQQQVRLQSREEFLASKINYNELYKNIIGKNNAPNNNKNGDKRSSSRKSRIEDHDEHERANFKVTPSPLQVTLPLELIESRTPEQLVERDQVDDDYSVAESCTVNGSEQVTLILPSSREVATEESMRRVSKEHQMVDEEELLSKTLHSLNRQTADSNIEGVSRSGSSEDASSKDGETSSVTDDDEHPGSSDAEHQTESRRIKKIANSQNDNDNDDDDQSSSLDLPSDSDEYDDDTGNDEVEEEEEEEEEGHTGSTCEDFATSEEFDAASDREENTASLVKVTGNAERVSKLSAS